MDVTIVFQKNWEAIQARNEDGTRRWRYIINEGSSRSSKTYSIIDSLDSFARQNAFKRITIWRDTKTDTVKTVFPDIEKRMRLTNRWLNGHRFHATTHILYYKGNTSIEIHGTDDDVTVHGLSGSVAWLNEPYHISRDLFDQIDQRTEDFIIIDWNPKQAHWIEDLKKDPRAIVIKSTFKDNPFCPPEQRAKILSYQPIKRIHIVEEKLLTEDEARNYNIIENLKEFAKRDLNELSRARQNEYQNSASEYKWSVYGLGEKAEKPNRIFHWSEIADHEYDEIDTEEFFWSDWGAVDPWAVGGAKYYDGTLYLKELNYASENIMRANMEPAELQIVSGEENGIVSWRFGHLNIPFSATILCDPNRKLKILALRAHGWEYAVAALKPPGSIIDGIDLLNNLKVCYTKSSANIKYEQENYSRKIDRYGIVLEEPEDIDNHHMDGIRYIGLHLESEGIIKKI